MKIVIVSAMFEEISPLLHKYNVGVICEINNQKIYEYKTKNNTFYLLNTGIGKVNAAITMTQLILDFKPNKIINIGTCGALNKDLKIGDAIIATKLCFHDVDVTSFNYKAGQIPGDELYYNTSIDSKLESIVNTLFENTHKGLIVTGDQFISKKEQKENIVNVFKNAYAVEMESSAIVRVANTYNVDISVIRTVSDLAYEKSNIEFDEYLDIVSTKFVKLVELIDE